MTFTRKVHTKYLLSVFMRAEGMFFVGSSPTAGTKSLKPVFKGNVYQICLFTGFFAFIYYIYYLLFTLQNFLFTHRDSHDSSHEFLFLSKIKVFFNVFVSNLCIFLPGRIHFVIINSCQGCTVTCPSTNFFNIFSWDSKI